MSFSVFFSLSYKILANTNYFNDSINWRPGFTANNGVDHLFRLVSPVLREPFRTIFFNRDNTSLIFKNESGNIITQVKLLIVGSLMSLKGNSSNSMLQVEDFVHLTKISKVQHGTHSHTNIESVDPTAQLTGEDWKRFFIAISNFLGFSSCDSHLLTFFDQYKDGFISPDLVIKKFIGDDKEVCKCCVGAVDLDEVAAAFKIAVSSNSHGDSLFHIQDFGTTEYKIVSPFVFLFSTLGLTAAYRNFWGARDNQKELTDILKSLKALRNTINQKISDNSIKDELLNNLDVCIDAHDYSLSVDTTYNMRGPAIANGVASFLSLSTLVFHHFLTLISICTYASILAYRYLFVDLPRVNSWYLPTPNDQESYYGIGLERFNRIQTQQKQDYRILAFLFSMEAISSLVLVPLWIALSQISNHSDSTNSTTNGTNITNSTFNDSEHDSTEDLTIAFWFFFSTFLASVIGTTIFNNYMPYRLRPRNGSLLKGNRLFLTDEQSLNMAGIRQKQFNALRDFTNDHMPRSAAYTVQAVFWKFIGALPSINIPIGFNHHHHHHHHAHGAGDHSKSSCAKFMDGYKHTISKFKWLPLSGPNRTQIMLHSMSLKLFNSKFGNRFPSNDFNKLLHSLVFFNEGRNIIDNRSYYSIGRQLEVLRLLGVLHKFLNIFLETSECESGTCDHGHTPHPAAESTDTCNHADGHGHGHGHSHLSESNHDKDKRYINSFLNIGHHDSAFKIFDYKQLSVYGQVRLQKELHFYVLNMLSETLNDDVYKYFYHYVISKQRKDSEFPTTVINGTYNGTYEVAT